MHECLFSSGLLLITQKYTDLFVSTTAKWVNFEEADSTLCKHRINKILTVHTARNSLSLSLSLSLSSRAFDYMPNWIAYSTLALKNATPTPTTALPASTPTKSKLQAVI